MVLLEIGVGLAILVAVLYTWVSWQYTYWTRYGVKQLPPTFPFGNLKDYILSKENIGVIYDGIYKESNPEPAVGIYKVFSQEFVIKDPKLVKDVLTKEFSSIHDNDIDMDSCDDIVFSHNPLVLNGDKWKETIRISSSALTPAKTKTMMSHIISACYDCVDYLKENQLTILEGKAIGGMFTSDVVIACAYGLQCNSFKDPDSEMRKHIAKICDLNTSLKINLFILRMAPSLGKLLQLRVCPKDVEIFFNKIVDETIEQRKNNSIQTEDFLQHLIDINEKEGGKMTNGELMAHSVTFIVNGYETSSLLISHMFDLLSQHPDVQVKLREEINSNFKSIDEFSFETLNSLCYLEAVINETLRMRPPASVISKMVTKDMTLQCGDNAYNLKKGMSISVPILSIQNDPKNFEEPDQFRPERFLDNPTPEAFLPFGLGPRQCLGHTFALTQVKACIAAINMNFDISPKEVNAAPFEAEPKSAILLNKKGGIWVRFRAVQ